MIRLKRHIYALVLFGFVYGGMALAPARAAASDWAVRCADDGSQCEAWQRLMVKGTDQRMAEIAIGFPDGADGPARGVMVLPLGIMLPAGVQLSIDGAAPYGAQVRYCTHDGCMAFLTLDEAVLNELRKGRGASLSFQSYAGQGVSLDVSLNGITAALKKAAATE